jgi:ankyrin repeat protein
MSSIHEAFPLKEFSFGMGYVANYKKALELLENGADPNELNEEGFNLLHLIGKCWDGRGIEELLDFFEYMPQVIDKALPLMKGKGINQKLKPNEEYEAKYKNSDLWSSYRWYGECTPLHFAVSGGYEAKGYAHSKTQKDIPHYKIKTMTWGEIDKKCKEYYEMFIKKLLTFGADKNIKNSMGENALESIGDTRTKISEQNKIKKILDKYQ